MLTYIKFTCEIIFISYAIKAERMRKTHWNKKREFNVEAQGRSGNGRKNTIKGFPFIECIRNSAVNV